jgi:hypothetical protein
VGGAGNGARVTGCERGLLRVPVSIPPDALSFFFVLRIPRGGAVANRSRRVQFEGRVPCWNGAWVDLGGKTRAGNVVSVQWFSTEGGAGGVPPPLPLAAQLAERSGRAGPGGWRRRERKNRGGWLLQPNGGEVGLPRTSRGGVAGARDGVQPVPPKGSRKTFTGANGGGWLEMEGLGTGGGRGGGTSGLLRAPRGVSATDFGSPRIPWGHPSISSPR